MSEKGLTIGMAQMKVEGGNPSANLARAEQMIGLASQAGCQIVVLPECLDLGWTHPSARNLAEPIPGAHSHSLARAARQEGVKVVAGLVERSGDQLFNSAILIDEHGEIELLHRKINELDFALDLYTVGDRLAIAKTNVGTIGLTICADNFPDSLSVSDCLCRMGCQLILSPCAWAVDADHDQQQQPYGELWRTAYGKLTRLYEVTVLGVSCVGWLTAGPWKGRKTIGCSLAIGPGGRVLAEGPYGEDAEALIPVEAQLNNISQGRGGIHVAQQSPKRSP